VDEDANGLLEWAREQHSFCAKAMLRAVSATTLVKHRPALGQTVHPARGSIVASPEMAAYDPNPDYFFHWLRDSAIVADALREAIEGKTLEPSAVEHLIDFVDFSLKLCRLEGPSFIKDGCYPKTVEPSFLQHIRSRVEIAEIIGDRALGETRYNADGSLDVLKWGRPQNDGPALRALAVMRFFSLDAFRARAGESALTLLRADLDYTLSRWRLPCCDLWEECVGFHYHTRLVQQAALAAGAKFLAVQGDAARSSACAAAAGELLVELDRHFDAEDGVYRGRLSEAGRAPDETPLRRLDIAVILGVIQAHRRAGSHSVVDPKMLATLAALERLFEREYPINRTLPANCAPALGRYAGDAYFSGGAYFFSTLGAAQYFFLLAQTAAEGVEILITEESRAPLAALLGAPAASLSRGALVGKLRVELAAAALRRGDMFLATVRRFTPASCELAEQFSQYDGAPTSSRNLSWSYASFILAYAARGSAVRTMGACELAS
jgi:glucoamylase